MRRFSFRWSDDRASGLAFVGVAQVTHRSRLLEDITLFITSFHANYPFTAKAHRGLGRCSRRTAPFAY